MPGARSRRGRARGPQGQCNGPYGHGASSQHVASSRCGVAVVAGLAWRKVMTRETKLIGRARRGPHALVLGVALAMVGCGSSVPAVRAGMPPHNTSAFAHYAGTI